MKIPQLDASGWRVPNPMVCAFVVVAGLLIQALALAAMGHPLICECGTIDVWHGAASGPQTSQHLTDWYSLTHVEHGLLFYAVFGLALANAPLRVVILAAFGLEIAWEIIENTPIIMDRYREGALAAGYFGDSVVNSISDTLAMAFGLLLARLLPVRLSLLMVIGLECVLILLIRDSLALNIIQLVHPVEAISRWQTGG